MSGPCGRCGSGCYMRSRASSVPLARDPCPSTGRPCTRTTCTASCRCRRSACGRRARQSSQRDGRNPGTDTCQPRSFEASTCGPRGSASRTRYTASSARLVRWISMVSPSLCTRTIRTPSCRRCNNGRGPRATFSNRRPSRSWGTGSRRGSEWPHAKRSWAWAWRASAVPPLPPRPPLAVWRGAWVWRALLRLCSSAPATRRIDATVQPPAIHATPAALHATPAAVHLESAAAGASAARASCDTPVAVSAARRSDRPAWRTSGVDGPRRLPPNAPAAWQPPRHPPSPAAACGNHMASRASPRAYPRRMRSLRPVAQAPDRSSHRR